MNKKKLNIDWCQIIIIELKKQTNSVLSILREKKKTRPISSSSNWDRKCAVDFCFFFHFFFFLFQYFRTKKNNKIASERGWERVIKRSALEN